MTKLRILQRDFDAAVKVPWGPETCLIAQFCIRNKKRALDALPLSMRCATVGALMNRFDQSFTLRDGGYIPNKRKLAKLRAYLPVTVEVEL